MNFKFERLPSTWRRKNKRLKELQGSRLDQLVMVKFQYFSSDIKILDSPVLIIEGEWRKCLRFFVEKEEIVHEIFLTLCLLIAFWGPTGEYLAQTNQSLEFEVAGVYNCPCKSSKYAFHSTSPASQTISEAAHKSVSVGNTVISKHLPQIIKNCLHSLLIVSLMQFWPSSFVNSCCVLQNLSSCIVSMFSLWVH